MSGTEGARTFSQRAGGTLSVQKPAPVNKNTVAQIRRRGIFAAAASAYKKLRPETWAWLAAERKKHPQKDALGKTVVLSVYAYFMKLYLGGWRESPAPKRPIEELAEILNRTESYWYSNDFEIVFFYVDAAMKSLIFSLMEQVPTAWRIPEDDGNTGYSTSVYTGTEPDEPIRIEYRPSTGFPLRAELVDGENVLYSHTVEAG